MTHPLVVALILLALTTGTLATGICGFALLVGAAALLAPFQQRRAERERVEAAWRRAKLGYEAAPSREALRNRERRRELGYR